ncbi:MAG: TonB-dependent receptor [Candidatus Marinimicrobia bacterium]|nr:TonB-dependent receptor [Candidatus Neomarinimicrobiota bacterium]
MVIALLLVPCLLLAQSGTIKGLVTDAENGENIQGADVILVGTIYGAATDLSGNYAIENVPNGEYRMMVSFMGYGKVEKMVTVNSGDVTVNIELSRTTLELSALEVLASRATRETPVAYTNIEKQDMQIRLGSQDIPLILNTTPSVYATNAGGGAGDSRINIRGFNQRNVSIMINGVPVNDMENGWVYWSNWDGVADATSSIQLQRGLSAVNLATPSIGGSMNIITDPAALKQGGKFKQEFGSGAFLKSTLNYNTGLINDKFAFSATVVRKTGDGIVDKAWTDAWAYYFGAAYNINTKNRLEFYALGAPQRHGQNRYKQNIAAYSHDFAKDLDDYDEAALTKYKESKSGLNYNENWNKIDSDIKTKEYFYMYGEKKVDRFASDFLNEIENYYHKPQINLNWYSTINDKLRLSTVAYFSGGSGGGTGTFGDMIWDYASEPTRIVDWNATIAMNQSGLSRKNAVKPEGESVGYLRNSTNRQWTVGAISKLNYKINDDLTAQVGVDWRTAEVVHSREVRNLLGGEYAVNAKYNNSATGDARYTTFYNEFDNSIEDAKVGLGDEINYFFTNNINWVGGFGQVEYTQPLYSVYGMAGYSMIKYSHVNHFMKAENHPGYDETDDGELELNSDWLTAGQVKGGGIVHLTEEFDAFGNFGFVQKAPILDDVIDDAAGTLASDPKNENFNSFEAGVNYRRAAGKVAAKANFYYTQWKNRSMTKSVQAGAGSSQDSDIIFLSGLNQTHMGVEAEVSYQPLKQVRFDGAMGYGMWEFDSDAEGKYRDYETNTTEEYTYAVKGLKVGDMPQTMVAFTTTYMPIKGASIQGVVNWYDRHFSDWDPGSREIGDDGSADRKQSWEAPGYTKIDIHAYYTLPFNVMRTNIQVFAHVFNVLDAMYIQDAVDNSAYNGFDKDHDADDAEVFFGTPRWFNVGLSIGL